MQTDTVVGIVGAVVLVSVMVGVFAYEYNATDDGPDGGDTTVSMNSFNATHPRLAASGDLDDDGIPNHQDMDLDGDGIPNAEDDSVATTTDLSGSVALSAGSAQGDSRMFHVDPGATSIVVSVSYNRPLPLPDAASVQPMLNFVLTDPEGQTHAGTETIGPAGDATVTLLFDLDGAPFVAGHWTLTATSNSLVAPAMAYTASGVVDYDLEA